MAVECAERLVQGWQDGDLRDIYAEMIGLMQSVSGAILFGPDGGREAEEIRAAFDALTAGGIAARLELLLLLLADRLPLPVALRFPGAVRRLESACSALIARRRTSVGERSDMLEVLLRADGGDGGGLTDEELRGEILTLFLAGYDTASIALTWTWYLLGRHPDVEAGLLAELHSVLGERAPTVEDLPRLRYTEQVVTEVMRLYPPAPMLSREALRDTEIGEYQVPRGTLVLMSQWVLHRDPRFFERPDEFDPDRWADRLAARLPTFAYLPFGVGPRACLGSQLARLELALLVATMAQRIRVEPVSGREIKPTASMLFRRPADTLRPEGGLWATVQRR